MKVFFEELAYMTKRCMAHEPHLKPLLVILAAAPMLSCASILWTYNAKAEVKLFRWGDHAAWMKVDPTKPSQVLFCNKFHRRGYVRDTDVEELRAEIYSFDEFSRSTLPNDLPEPEEEDDGDDDEEE